MRNLELLSSEGVTIFVQGPLRLNLATGTMERLLPTNPCDAIRVKEGV